MSTIQIAGRELSLNKKGYLARLADWDRLVAAEFVAV